MPARLINQLAVDGLPPRRSARIRLRAEAADQAATQAARQASRLLRRARPTHAINRSRVRRPRISRNWIAVRAPVQRNLQGINLALNNSSRISDVRPPSTLPNGDVDMSEPENILEDSASDLQGINLELNNSSSIGDVRPLSTLPNMDVEMTEAANILEAAASIFMEAARISEEEAGTSEERATTSYAAASTSQEAPSTSREAPTTSEEAPSTSRAAAAARVANGRGNGNETPWNRPERGSLQRIKRELQAFMLDPVEGCSVTIDESNIYRWEATINGPPGTPYEGGIFHLTVVFPQNYPFSPPIVTVKTNIYHCNISVTGKICMDILSHEWSPALTISKVLLSTLSLLTDPNPEDPMRPALGTLLRSNPNQYEEFARLWTCHYAIPDVDIPKKEEPKDKDEDAN